ncbi:MATE family efflux transporter [Liquorilactobacillus hordei]|uniref:MATE family efflux transporter n=1 Tax=Liquorilactobacillus hordei TaxID=468911 RepID=A0A3S6QM09_9LACO|nr:MATE family efflux transporter [Liquorilactobacillus hordei]AUJ28913.1 MATE family efflux transporter [Liquorilactobacillus hordei]MBZ2406312.1 MATE family efflux transporter [Liquorilactobacillus hordei]
MESKKTIIQEFANYTVKNIFASLGLSLYVIVDTLFIAIAAGAIGLASLNIVLPIFNLFNSVGLMLGIGGATIYSMNKGSDGNDTHSLYGQLLVLGVSVGIFFIIIANIFTNQLLYLMGANSQTITTAAPYLRIISLSAPLFIINYVSVNFIRNDGNPKLTMLATLSETGVVVLIDYLFVFVLKLGMNGAAFATLFAPLTSLIILTNHRFFPNRKLKLKLKLPNLTLIKSVIRLGFPSLLTELSTGVSIFFFNIVLLRLGGNYEVAAYGVIANIAIIALAFFNGISFGMQPLVAREYGKNHWKNVRKLLNASLVTCLVIALFCYLFLVIFKYPVINIFNNDHSNLLVMYASYGIPLYFLSLFFSGININVMIFSVSINQPRLSFFISLLRGYLILLPTIILFGYLFGITGVWLSVPFTELSVTIFSILFLRNILTQDLA